LEISLQNAQRAERLDLAGLRRFLDRLVDAKPPARADRMGIRFVTDRAMRDYNRRYRGKDAPTDVLSFPDGAPDSEGGRNLGDILVSVGTARRQARSAGHSLGREMRILILHGYLHLLGYDHEADQGQMRRLERRLSTRLMPSRGSRT
jgi:probable rRNA maturation factor